MKLREFVLLLCLLMLCSVACEDSSDSEEVNLYDIPIPKNTFLTFNPGANAQGLLAGYKPSEGSSTFYFYGYTDANGDVESVNAAVILSVTKDTIHYVTFDNQSRVKETFFSVKGKFNNVVVNNDYAGEQVTMKISEVDWKTGNVNTKQTVKYENKDLEVVIKEVINGRTLTLNCQPLGVSLLNLAKHVAALGIVVSSIVLAGTPLLGAVAGIVTAIYFWDWLSAMPDTLDNIKKYVDDAQCSQSGTDYRRISDRWGFYDANQDGWIGRADMEAIARGIG